MSAFRTGWVWFGLRLAVTALPVGCACPRPTNPIAAGPIAPAAVNHVVFFKLKDSADADALIADSREMLGRIPGVLSLFAGKHIDAGRATVQSDYDACVYVGFATLDDYAAYVAHPNHTGLVVRWGDRFEWYRVYDVGDATFDATRGNGR